MIGWRPRAVATNRLKLAGKPLNHMTDVSWNAMRGAFGHQPPIALAPSLALATLQSTPSRFASLQSLPLIHDARRRAPTSHPSFNRREFRPASLLVPGPNSPTFPSLGTPGRCPATRPCQTHRKPLRCRKCWGTARRDEPCQPNPVHRDRNETAPLYNRTGSILPSSSISSTPQNHFNGFPFIRTLAAAAELG